MLRATSHHTSPGIELDSRRGSLLRSLALAKLRELRRGGLSYREIGMYFAPPRRLAKSSPESTSRLIPAGLVIAKRPRSDPDARDDRLEFLHALDQVSHGIAFFDLLGRPLHTNRILLNLCCEPSPGHVLQGEVDLFADDLRRLVRLRALNRHSEIERLGARDVRIGERALRLRGSYVGLPLFGEIGTILISVELLGPHPLSEEALIAEFGLTRQQSKVSRLLAEGCGNAEIARRLSISPHTARHHTERVLRKLELHSRSEVAAKLLWPRK